jgi:hypothetical protein
MERYVVRIFSGLFYRVSMPLYITPYVGGAGSRLCDAGKCETQRGAEGSRRSLPNPSPWYTLPKRAHTSSVAIVCGQEGGSWWKSEVVTASTSFQDGM